MIAKRAAALLVALVMIAVSLVVRNRVLDGDNNAGAAPSGATKRLTCVTELAAACETIARASNGHVRVTVEPAGTTAAKILGATDAAALASDGWLTLAPWPEIAAQQRAQANRDPVLGPTSSRLGRSPLVIAIRKDRFAILTRKCKVIDWTCTGTQANKQWSQLGGDVTWGRVKPAHAEPVQSATGLLVLGQAVGGFLAAPGHVEQVSSNDFDSNAAFPGWFQQLETSVPPDALEPGADPFARWLTHELRTYSLVGGIEAEIGPGLAGARAVSGEATVTYPAPMASADVVFAPIGAGGNDLMKIVSSRDAGAALAAAGWRVDGQQAIAGVATGPLPKGTGLPPAGTLYALQKYWKDVVR